jgi:hypothetical protein
MSRIKQDAAPVLIRVIRSLVFFLTEHEDGKDAAQKKSRAFDLARLRLGEIYSLWLYRILSFVSPIILDEVESFNSKKVLALCGGRGVTASRVSSGTCRRCPIASA